MTELTGCRPEIEYPCQWYYRIIGEDRGAMVEAITRVIDLATCTLTDANVSSGGRYLSLSLELTVNGEGERLRIHQLLAGSPAIRMVL